MGSSLRKETTAMKGRALGATFVVALISALTGSLAWADNPHSAPPGQAAKDSASVSASPAADNQGQAKKADEASVSASATISASASLSASTSASNSTSARHNGQGKDH